MNNTLEVIADRIPNKTKFSIKIKIQGKLEVDEEHILDRELSVSEIREFFYSINDFAVQKLIDLGAKKI